MSYKVDYLPPFCLVFINWCLFHMFCWDPFYTWTKVYRHILSLYPEFWRWPDYFRLDRFTHPELLVPSLTTAGQPNIPVLEKSVTSYCSWRLFPMLACLMSLLQTYWIHFSSKVNHELFIVKCIPFVISERKIKPCCLFLHRLGGWLKGKKKASVCCL